MSEVLALIKKCLQLGLTLTPTSHGTLRVRPSDRLPAPLREELRLHKPGILAYLRQQMKHSPLSPEEREFLRRHASALPWEEPAAWEALQVWFKLLGMYVWLVRDGAALLPLLITGGVQ